MAKNAWGDEIATDGTATTEDPREWGDKPAAQKDLPAGVDASSAGGGRGRVNPPTIAETGAELERPSFRMPSPAGNRRVEPVRRRESVLDGVDIPEEAAAAARERIDTARSTRRGAEALTTEGMREPRTVMQPADRQLPNMMSMQGGADGEAGTAVRVARRIGASGAEGAWGAVRAGAEAVGADRVAEVAKHSAQAAADYQGGMGRPRPVEGFGPSSPVPYLQDMAEGAATSLGQSALYATAFGARAVIPLMSLQSAGTQYQAARSAGKTPGEALANAIPYGAFEALGEKFQGLDKAAKALHVIAGGRATRQQMKAASEVLITAGVREIPGELVTYLGQTAVDLLPGIGIRNDLTTGQFLDGLRDTVVQSAMMGGAIGAGGVAAGGRARAKPPELTAEQIARQKGFLQQQDRIKQLSASGEKEVAGVLQRRLDTEQAEAELGALADKPYGADPEFQQRYRQMRVQGVKPAEASSRAAMFSSFSQIGSQAGLTPKAVERAAEAAAKLPLDEVPAFLERYTASLAQKGIGAGLPQGTVAGAVGGVGDDAMNAAIDNIARLLGVEAQGAAAAPAAPESAAVAPAEAATAPEIAASVAREGDFDPGNDVRVTPEAEAVHAAATSPLNDLPEPTDSQKKAGNYRVGRVRIAGLDISIENPQGSTRRGTDADGKPWETPMRDHYGYVRGTTAADGDKLDVFVKPGTPEDYRGPVFVVDQVDPRTGEFDEHKVVLGAADEAEAEALYRRNYSADWQGLAAMTRLPMPAFRSWAESKRTKEPLGDLDGPQGSGSVARDLEKLRALDTGYKAPADAAGALRRLGVEPTSTTKETEWQLDVNEMGSVFVAFDPVTGKATVKADWQGKTAAETTAEGGAAIAEAVERAREGIERAEIERVRQLNASKASPATEPPRVQRAAGSGLEVTQPVEESADSSQTGSPPSGKEVTKDVASAPPSPQSPPAAPETPALAGVSVSGAGFPPVSQFDGKVNLGPAGLRKVTVVASGQPTFRETDVGGLDDRMREDRQAVPFNSFVADRQELAIGQGVNRGVHLVFRADSVSGREHAKPMTGDLTGREYRADLLAPRAVQAITLFKADLKTARGLTKQRLAAEFDRADLPDGRVHFTRKGLPRVAPPELAPITVTRNASGTVSVEGDLDTIRRVLESAGITRVMKGKNGLLVGKTQAAQAEKAMASFTTKPAGAAAAPAAAGKPLMMGTAPGNAEPVTVRDGVIFIGKYEALDFDSGEPVSAPAGATAEDLKRILKDAGAITSKQKFFGGQEAAAPETAARRGFDFNDGPPLTTDQVKAAVQEIVARWENGPPVHVVLSPRQLPGENDASTRGLYTRDHGLWIVSGLNRTRKKLAATLAHEAIAHYGLRHMLGKDRWLRLMDNIQAAAERGDKAILALRDEVRTLYKDADGNNLRPQLEADEIAAFAVEKAVGEDGKYRPGFEWVKSIYAAAAEFLRGLGINVPFTAAELQGMLVLAQQHLKVGKRTSGGGDILVAAARADTPLQAPDATVGASLGSATGHPDYEAAKAGDLEAAVRLAQDLVTADLVAKVRAGLGAAQPLVLPVAAEEGTGRNAIPRAAAEVLAAKLGLKTATGIVQANRAHRTGLDGLDRIFADVDFDGAVVPGDYLLLDDTLTQGGTFAALVSHVEAGGGRVVGIVALTGKQYSAKIQPAPATLQALRKKHGDLEDQFRAATGHGFDALTQSEARYLASFEPAQRLRDRIAEEARRAGERKDQSDPGQAGVGDAFDESAQARAATETDVATTLSSPRSLSRWRDATGRLQFAPGQALYDLIGKAADPLLTALQLKAASPALRRALREMKNEVRKAQETAAAVAGETNKLSAAERAMVSDIVEKELAAGTVPPEHAVRLATMINDVMGKQTDELVRLGMLEEGSAEKWRGQYLPRFYESKLTRKAADAWADAVRRITGRPRVMAGIRGKHLKGRGLYETIPDSQLQHYEELGWEVRDPDYRPGVPTADGTVQVWRDFTREERDRMGEIRDAGFRFVMGYMQTQHDIALGKMFEGLAADGTISSRTQTETFGVQVPTSTVAGTGAKTYGKLAGRWVSKDTLSHLSAIEEAQSEAWQLYRKGLAIWKEGKTALNPVSHVNNIVSNITMAHFAGVSYWDGHKYLSAVRDLAGGAPLVKEARDAGLFGGTISEAELMNMLPRELQVLARQQEGTSAKVARTAFNVLTFYLRRPMGAAYQAEDSLFRYLIYRDARKRGVDIAEAVDYAQRYIFTYDDLPKGARRIRDIGIPFFSYTYKAAPALLYTALTHPLRMAAPAAVLWAANAAAYAIAVGDDDDDWEERLRKYLQDSAHRERARELEALERENLPPWMKGTTALLTPKTVRLGMDELTKLPLFIDMARVIPGGDLFDVSPNAGGLPIPQPITPSNPLFTIAVAMIGNKDLFLGKELVDTNDTRAEAAEKRAAWMWRQLAPAVAAGSYHWQRGMNALAQATGKEVTWLPEALGGESTGIGRDSLPVQPHLAAMQTFGIKVRPIDIERSMEIGEGMREKMIREIDAEVRSLKRLHGMGAISDRAFDKADDLAREKKERLEDGLTVDGEKK